MAKKKTDQSVMMVKVSLIDYGTNLRNNTPLDQEFVDSVRQHGVLQPLLLTYGSLTPKGTRYECVCGHRRLAASREVELELVPALVRELTAEEVIEIQLAENCHRQDLDPIEEGKAYRQLLAKYPVLEELAERVNRKVSYVHGRMCLLLLPDKVQEMVSAGDVSLAVGQLVAKMPEDRRRIACEQLTARTVQLGHDLGYWRKWANDELNPMISEALFDTSGCDGCSCRGGSQFFDSGLDDRCYDRSCWNQNWQEWIACRARGAGANVVDSEHSLDYYDMDSDCSHVPGFDWLAAERAGLTNSSLRQVLRHVGTSMQTSFILKPSGIWIEVANGDEVHTALQLAGVVSADQAAAGKGNKKGKKAEQQQDGPEPSVNTGTDGEVPFSEPLGRDALEKLAEHYAKMDATSMALAAYQLVTVGLGVNPDHQEIIDELAPGIENTVVRLLLCMHVVADRVEPVEPVWNLEVVGEVPGE